MENEEVVIDIKTIQSSDGQREIIGESYRGFLDSAGDEIIAHYDNEDENGKISCQLHLSKDGCAIITDGAIQRILKFEVGVRHDCPMNTEVGTIQLETYTHDYDYEDLWRKRGRIRLRISYDLYSSHELLTQSVLNLTIKRKRLGQ